MSTALARRETDAVACSPQEVLTQMAAVQSVMKAAMRQGEHYGTIPGCGTKATLLKPGAEKLLFTFRLGTRIATEAVHLTGGHLQVTARVTVFRLSDNVTIGEGVGCCSSMESKYRYRTESTGTPVPQEYWDSRDQSLLGGPSFSPKKGKSGWEIVQRVEHDNPADYHNTVMKMAKKRALVDAVLTATAASDCFTQDLEDIQENMRVYGADAGAEDAATTEAAPSQSVHRVASAPQPHRSPPRPAIPPRKHSPPPQAAAPSGDWRDVPVHFGKNRGVKLGQLNAKTLSWYQEEWMPKPFKGRISDDDMKLRAALDASLEEQSQPRSQSSFPPSPQSWTDDGVAMDPSDDDDDDQIPGLEGPEPDGTVGGN